MSDNDWIEWSGGDCPVKKGTLLDVRYRDGYIEYKIPSLIPIHGTMRKATNWFHHETDGDIVAYKIIEQEFDTVERPTHYQLLPGVEFIDVRQALLSRIPQGTPYGQVDDWSRAFEYIGRMWGKNGLEDAKKARVYLNWLIEKMESDNESE